MATKSRSYKSQKTLSSLLVNGILIFISLLWFVPTLGVLVTSFRNSEDIFRSGWWTVFPHKAFIESGEIKVEEGVDVNAPMTIEGAGPYTFEELRAGGYSLGGAGLALRPMLRRPSRAACRSDSVRFPSLSVSIRSKRANVAAVNSAGLTALSPSRSARVVNPARSDPDPGSLNS